MSSRLRNDVDVRRVYEATEVEVNEHQAEEIFNPKPPKKKVTRESRKPFGSTDQKLAYPKRANYHRHWFNDDPGRIQMAEEAGYSLVHGHDGKPTTRIVGTRQGGAPINAYLMEIPQEWYDEDMLKQQTAIDEKEKGIRRGFIEKADPKDRAVNAFYTGSDKGQIDIHDSYSKSR